MISIGATALVAVAICGPASASFVGARCSRSQIISSHRTMNLPGTSRLRSFSDGSSEDEELDMSFISSIEKLVRDDDESQTLILTTARKQRMQKEIGLLV